VIVPSQKPLPNNEQYSQETDNHAFIGIRTRNRRKLAVPDTHLRPRGHWDRPFDKYICVLHTEIDTELTVNLIPYRILVDGRGEELII